MSTVYILTNESMPDWIKIGISDGRLNDRILELDNTSVPLPFSLFYAAKVADYRKVERILHQAFDDYRPRKKREFFYKLDPNKVKVILEAFAVEVENVNTFDSQDHELAKAMEASTRRTGRYSFGENGIPLGAVLHYVKNPDTTCVVHSDDEVEFQGQVLSISRAARYASVSNGGPDYPVSGPLYWLYEDNSLNAIRSARMESEGGE
jgi:hypothetical protein